MSVQASSRLYRQLRFIRQADRLKTVLRQSLILSGGRRENSAEHSWYLALMVMVFHEHASRRVNLAKALQLALVHDVPELLTGDTFIYDKRARARKAKLEARAAVKVFGLLPPTQAKSLHRLWLEYEEGKTAEARFVRVMDRLAPVLCNFATNGYAWRKHGITAQQVADLKDRWKPDAPALALYTEGLIRSATRKGMLKAAKTR